MKTALRGESLIWLTGLYTLVMLSEHALGQEDEFLEVADYLEFEELTDVQISPDGQRILYTRSWVDLVKDRRESAIWIMKSDGSQQRFLTQGSNARWSREGDRILFIGIDDNDKPQIFVRWMNDEGAVSQVTRIDSAPTSPEWSPDGTQIAFVAIVPAEDAWNIDLPMPPEGAEWSQPPRVLDRLHYRQDRLGFTKPGFTHLFVVPAEGGTPRQLTEGEWNVGAQFDGLFIGAGLDWTADSSRIVFDGLRDADWDLAYQESHIYAVDVASKEIAQLTVEPGFWTSPVVSPGGGRIAYTGY